MRPPARGFSLVELLVAVAVSAIVLAGGIALLLGTQRSFQSGVADRAMQEAARVALGELTTSLRSAGYGLEPTFTFDLGQAPTVMDRLPIGSQPRFGGYQCPNAVSCRDSVAGPDELVFYARAPSFSLSLSGPTGGASITVAGPLRTPLRAGQILQLMCYGTGNEWLWAYITVDRDVAPDTASATISIPFRQPPNGAQALDFPYQNELLQRACFNSGARQAFKIDRYRYYLAAIDEAGVTQPWETAGTRPYLMLDQGLSTGPVAVAPDVEDLQVAYVFPLAAGAQVVGATSGQAMTADPAGIDLVPSLGIPSFATPSLDPIRTTHHPANIRAVRVAVTVRSERQDRTYVGDACAANVPAPCVPAALNRPAVAAESGYRRLVFETTIYTHNLENRLPVFPILDPTATTASCAGTVGNCGGG